MHKSKKFTHGERNKFLAEKLNNEKVYFDWVVTVAFYSAIHLLEGKILPCKVGIQECKNIQEVREAYNLKGRHVARFKLIERFAPPEISIGYKWLDDRSRYARYITFKIDNAVSDKAVRHLNDIHKYCTQKN